MAPPALLLSESPLCAWLPDFATAEECRLLVELGFRTARKHNQQAQEMQQPQTGGEREQGGARPALRGVATARLNPAEQDEEGERILEAMQHRVAALVGIPMHDEEMHPFLKFDHPGDEPSGAEPASGKPTRGPPADDLNIGLHMDINGGFPHCVCSVILYLNACEGGRTVFPAFQDERSRDLGAQIASGGHTHTSHSGLGGCGEAAAELVECGSRAPGALRVSPQRGAALVFFTLLGRERTKEEAEAGDERYAPAPAPDPHSWHGGSDVQGDIGKWTLQIFKEVPLAVRQEGPAREARYVAELRERLARAARPPAPGMLDEMD